MKRTWKIVGLFVGVFLLAVSIHVLRASGQVEAVTGPSDASKDQAKQALLIVRSINTGEYSCRKKDEKENFLPWEELLNAPCFSRFQSSFSQVSGFPLSPGPEIVPGLELRMMISPDGKHYNLWLGQKPVGNCAFAFYSDERGVIYEGASLGCDSPGVR
jgi:hypothetical protein